MPTFALLDVVTPYVLGGAAIGDPFHELLSVLFVTELETSFDDTGIAISGIARFSPEVALNPPTFTPPASISWNGAAGVDHNTIRTPGAFWDFPDIAITFRLTCARASSPAANQVLATGLNNPALTQTLIGLGQANPGDAPNTAFHLDLLIDAATLHLPFLTGAKLLPDGRLAADPDHPEITVTLPKLKFSLSQTAGTTVTDPQFRIDFDSFAAHDIDDPAGAGYGELIRMNPPYALFGSGDWIGFGFASVVLDLSSTSTPPELMAKFGVGEDFRGLYFPDVRIFLQPGGASGLAFDISARELLIGIGPEGGLSGIFGLDIVKPDAAQAGTISIYDEFGGLVRRVDIPPDPGPANPPPLEVDPTPVPAITQWVVDVIGGQPPYNISVDGQVQTSAPITITVAAGAGAKTVEVVISDIHTSAQRHVTLPLSLSAPSLTAPAGGTSTGPQTAAIAGVGAMPAGHSVTMLDNPGAEQVTIIVSPESPSPTATITRDGSTTALALQNGRATVPLQHGKSIDVIATWDYAAKAASPVKLTAQFQYDQPQKAPNNPNPGPDEQIWDDFARIPGNIRTIRSKDAADPYGDWEGEDNFLVTSPEFAVFVEKAQQSTLAPITMDGAASKEHVASGPYNVALSLRRIWALQALLRQTAVTNPVTPNPQGEQPAGGNYLEDGRSIHRQVNATVNVGASPADSKSAQVHVQRPSKPSVLVKIPPTVVERKPVGSDSARFKELHIRVQFDHSRLIAAEAKLKIDIKTALESYLAKVKQQNPQIPASANPALPVGKAADPNDGVLDFRMQLTLDDTVGKWQLLLSMFENDKDGFLQTPPPTAAFPPPDSFLRDFFGLMIALAPLVDAGANAGTTEGAVIGLALGAGVPLAAALLGVVHVQRITLYGGELVIDNNPQGTSAALLMDVEVAIVVALPPVIETDPKNPITVRYKAVGFSLSKTPGLRDLLPVFDSSKGFTINVPSSGGIRVPDPLGDIIQVAGTRIARSNPVNIELDLELKADLGVVSVDRTTVRIPLEGGQAPTISALGVHINVAGAIEGSGYLAIFDDGFAGQLDVSLPGLGIRVAAGLSVRHVPHPPVPGQPEATAILLTLEVDFPVPIALGASGLGIYGFGGLFALHYRRDEHPGDPVPALDWLKRVAGNPLDIKGWVPEIDHWAIGLGALLGTMDSGFVLNVKGMLIFEMPGPRILLVMKAKIIWPRPPRKGSPTATILAVIDIDLGRGRITIGLTFDYEIKPLLSIHLPVRAIFPFDDLAHFAIDVGTWYDPGTVTFFEIFKARGYFMIRGKGIPDTGTPPTYDQGHTDFPLPYSLGGFSIATGVSVSYTWGKKSSGLYISVGSSFDVGLGFSPIMFQGVLKLWGELHLWIMGIEASAQLTIVAGQVPDGPPVQDPEYPNDPTKTIQPTKNLVLIDGEVRGEIDLFFFSISGSVHVSLGNSPGSPPKPPDLITGMSLQSRAAALLAGINSDRPIDGKLADAHPDGAAIDETEAVPIDSILVLHLDCGARVAGGAVVEYQRDGSPVTSAIDSTTPTTPAVRRGEPYYTYQINKITVGGAEVSKGDTPSLWWPNVPNPGPETKREYALLTRVPDPHPSSVERSKHAEHHLEQHWQTICNEVAPPTIVLWTFHAAALGPSSIGWLLNGTAWPDPPGSTRSVAPNLRLDVAETWRTDSPDADQLADIAPARVIGSFLTCSPGCARNQKPNHPWGLPIASVGNASSIRNFVALASRAEQLGSVGLPLSATRTPAVDTIPARAAARGCYARVLEAPFLRTGDLDILGHQHPLGQLIADLIEKAAAQGNQKLDDIIAFKTGPIVRTRMLLWVPRQILQAGALILRLFDAAGTVLEEIQLDGSGGPSVVVHSYEELPGDWIDPEGPWHCRVDEVWRFFDSLKKTERGLVVLVDDKVADTTEFVQLGVVGVPDLLRQGLTRPSYLVGVFDTLTSAEMDRSELETKTKKDLIQVVNGALSPDQNPPALLLPGCEYNVKVDWGWAVCDEHGAVPAAGTWTPQSQTFRFRTDNEVLKPRQIAPVEGGAPQTMPVRLDPWVLTSDPAEGDKFRFHQQSIKITFAVDYLLTMFSLYGKDLKVQVRAASFKNAPGSPTFPLTWADLNTTTVKPLKGAAVLTPWEDMMSDLMADKECIPTVGDKVRHQILDINLLLQPRTDYILDIEIKDAPPPGPTDTVRPLFRRNFSTSRYGDTQAMCADVMAAGITESPATTAQVAGLVDLAAAPAPVSATALDAALRSAGLRPVVDVEGPEIEVLWVEVAGIQQPRFLIIRAPEPLVRNRKEPAKYEPAGQPRLQREVIQLVDKPYLEVRPTGVAGSPSITVVSNPSMNTVIVMIDDGRGKTIDLSVRQHDAAILGEGTGFTDIGLLQVLFDKPTWEVL